MARIPESEWWRSAVVYQIYPRSFADSNQDGTGDLRGIIERLPYVAGLGVDAIWISPWYPSPLADGGYDISDYRSILPDFGTLADGEALIAAAHAQGLRVLIDLVPNHSSDQHAWFQQALAAGPGSPERARYVFRDGRGEHAELPPNNWPSMFGGDAWKRVANPDGSPGQWYLHLFAPEQPDWNWENPEVVAEFDRVLRFWFDRGVDGFRIDAANTMAKQAGMPDLPDAPSSGNPLTALLMTGTPYTNQPEVHEIFRHWRTVADGYAGTPGGPRVFVAEAWVSPAERLAQVVRADELHTTFNFDALLCEWTASSERNVINQSLAALGAVGAPATWVLGNHDTPRVVSRLGRPVTGLRFGEGGYEPVTGDGPIGGDAGAATDVGLGRRRARAAALLELALPGGAYVYQGDELGLEEVEDLPDDVLQDPVWERSGHTSRGRDGNRIPTPWSGTEPPFGFGGPGAPPWLPQPPRWAALTVDAQEDDPKSFLTLYRSALAERRRNPALGDGTLRWDGDTPRDVLSFTRDPGFRCVVNFGAEPYPLTDGEVVLASGDLVDGVLGTDQAAWLRTEPHPVG